MGFVDSILVYGVNHEENLRLFFNRRGGSVDLSCQWILTVDF